MSAAAWSDGSSSGIVQVPVFDNIVALSAGGLLRQTVEALRGDGAVWRFGTNASGELGDGTTMHRSTPVQAIGINLNWTPRSLARRGNPRPSPSFMP
jgi:hypothetical protein